MITQNKEYNTFEQLLPNWLKDCKFLTDFLSGYEYIIKNYIEPRIEELKTCSSIRDKNTGYKTYKNLEILQKKAYELGIKININNYTKEQLGRLLENYAEYNKIIVSESQLGNFLGEILNTSLNIEKLWAEGTVDPEYKNLTPDSELEDNKKITAFKSTEAPLGFFFPTSNYNIYYDILALEKQDQQYIQEFENKVKELFDNIAPLNYVLQNVISKIYIPETVIYIGSQPWEKFRSPTDLTFSVDKEYYTKNQIDSLLNNYLSESSLIDSDFNRLKNKIQLKDEVVDINKINNNLLAKNINLNDPTSTKLTTELSVVKKSNEYFNTNETFTTTSENYNNWKESFLTLI